MRNLVTEAIILRKYRIGEIHKGLVIFSKDLGLISIIAHGAYTIKNRFRTATEPLTHSIFYIYRNPVKDSCKLTGIEPLSEYKEITYSVKKYFIASLWAEIILKSCAGGESYTELFCLFDKSLVFLSELPDKDADIVSIQFSGRFLMLNGSMPDISLCSLCGRYIPETGNVFYLPLRDLIYCKDCKHDGCSLLPAGGRAYLNKTLQLDIRQVFKTGIDSVLRSTVKKFIYNAVEGYIDTPLKSLQSGGGIL